MYPAYTTYRLAQAGGEFNKLYALMRKRGLATRGGMLQFPTVVAERDGKIVGFLSTSSTDEGLYVGPLVCDGPIMAMRLTEAMELVLVQAGVSRYLVSVPEVNVARIEELGYVPFGDGIGAQTMLRRL